MRGAYLIGIVVVLLIIGYLIMKNMGVDNQSDIRETQTKAYMEKADKAADDLNQKYQDIKKKAPLAE